MRPVILSLLIAAALAPAQDRQRFTGTLTDAMCATGDHSKMRMGANDAECTIACVHSHGVLYVLYDGKQAYVLSDQRTTEKLAGKRVAVTGKLDAKTMTIQVDSITQIN